MEIILGLISIIFSIFIIVGIIAIIPFSCYFLIKYLKKKGIIYRNIGIIIIIVIIIFIGGKLIFGPSGFGPEYDSAVIKQKIGGKLLCNSVFTADLHSWVYDVSYKYINTNGDTIDLSRGSYCGREWNKDEQIRKYNSWLILVTGASHGSERLILKNIESDSTLVFNINNEFIENNSQWKILRIKSLLNYCCAETKIVNIYQNVVVLKYKFRIDSSNTEKYDERLVSYLIDNDTGNLSIIKIQ